MDHISQLFVESLILEYPHPTNMSYIQNASSKLQKLHDQLEYLAQKMLKSEGKQKEFYKKLYQKSHNQYKQTVETIKASHHFSPSEFKFG